MQDNFNTASGWVLFSGIIALGLTSLSGKYFHADKPERPETMGYPIEGVVEEGEGGADAGPDLATLLASADVAAGETAAQGRCGTCHTFDQGGAAKQGPNLFGVMGKPIGKHAAGFAYSSALSGHGGDWTYENMDAWLKSPKAFAAGTKMSFAGLSNAQDRANIILYMRQQGGGPALPTPVAAEAPAADAAEAAAAGDPTAAAGPATTAGPDAAGAVAAPAGEGATKSTVPVQ
jgi:cytochrome c